MTRLKENTATLLRCLAMTVLMVFTAPGIFEWRKSPTDTGKNVFEDRSIRCVISLGDDMKGADGLVSGFCYELLRKFAAENNFTMTAIAEGDHGEEWIDSLRNGSIDIMVLRPELHEGNCGLNISHRLSANAALATASGHIDEIIQFNNWLNRARVSGYYETLRKKYFRKFNPLKRAGDGEVSGTISPYDDLIKKYASGLGWDWRLLAALVYQESKFSISSKSHRGARGLMQVMPNTAKHYEIDDLTDPDMNLFAGTSHLKRLQKMLGNDALGQEELLKFTLAAYNAGEGRIKYLRGLAAERQADPDKWEDVADIIPLACKDPYLNLNKFNGYETIEYVKNVMALYDAICRICPKK